MARVLTRTFAHCITPQQPSADAMQNSCESKQGESHVEIQTLDAIAPGVRADHFGWLKAPDVVAEALLRAA